MINRILNFSTYLHYRLILGLLFCTSIFISPSVLAQEAQAENPLQAEAILTPSSFESQQNTEIKIKVSLPNGYSAYADKFKLKIKEPSGFKSGKLEINPITKFYDQNTKKTKEGVVGVAQLTALLEAPADLSSGDHKLKFALTYQACTATYCLFPIDLNIEVPFSVIAKPGQITDNLNVSAALNDDLFSGNLESFFSRGLLWTFLAVFIAGFLTSLTPCVFPMIPITIAVLGKNAHLRTKGHNFLLANLYVLGIALTYSALGIFAAATGAMFGSFMSHPVVLTVICMVFLAMALSMFGLYEMQAPLFIRQRLGGDLHVKGFSAAFVYGIVAGVVAGPCVGPVLVGILTYVAKTQNLWLGFWLLFVFAFGMGQLFLLIGVSSQLTKLLPKSGTWMESVKIFFGVMMMGAFFYYLGLLIPIRWWDGLFGLGLVVGGSLLGAFDPIAGLSLARKLNKGVWQAVIFIGAAFLTVAILNLRPQFLNTSLHAEKSESVQSLWQNYSDEKLQTALAANKPVLIDFWADWCAACKELEKVTFANPRFQTAARDFVLLKFNATDDSPQLELLRTKYGLVGLPTIIFYDTKGQIRNDLTVNEFIEAPAFVERMQRALK